ncbi:hypothetical protein HF086_014453 [Spodoptera exigua]|uniref:RNA-directed DNA polymerase n=1 Tax=Spodoptera exigua TaxID=7107 RepID=A0A922MAW7_SPOEX|nr:hypothetical protein HF086_014453 [Spodoptera exigua]
MISELESYGAELKKIKVYLIKIGPARREGTISKVKFSEAQELYDRFSNYLITVESDLKSGKIKGQDISLVETAVERINVLYNDIVKLCNVEELIVLSKPETKMSTITFDLKTALNLLPVLTNEETVTKQLIDNIEYYDSILSTPECKQNLIKFVLKSRLSQAAKLKLKTTYSSVSSLVQDMRSELLPKKAATAIQTKLQKIRQHEKSISNYGEEINELFVDLTISQANGDTKCYEILKPINEKLAIKQFADGLRNRKLSTIISARNYDSLKDAIQAAQDEEVSLSGSIYFSHLDLHQGSQISRAEFVNELENLCAQEGIGTVSIVKCRDNEIFIKKLVEEINKRKHKIKITLCVLNNVQTINNKDDRRVILNDFHLLPSSGHAGMRRMSNNIKKYYYWPGLEKDVKEFLKRCDKCQRQKYSLPIKEPIIITTTSNTAFEKIYLDIVGPLDTDNYKNTYILTLQCELTKYVEAYALQTKQANEVARNFVNNFILRYGVPKEIATDRGQEFMSIVFKEDGGVVVSLYNILLSTLYLYNHVFNLLS